MPVKKKKPANFKRAKITYAAEPVTKPKKKTSQLKPKPSPESHKIEPKTEEANVAAVVIEEISTQENVAEKAVSGSEVIVQAEVVTATVATATIETPQENAASTPKEESAETKETPVTEKSQDSPVESEASVAENTPVQETTQEEIRMKDEQITMTMTEDSSKKGRGWIVIAAIIIGVLLATGAFLYSMRSKQELANLRRLAAMEPKETPIVKPTPTPEEVDKKKYAIEILNGSGIAGEAARAKTLLEDEGFKVDSVGNATNSAFTKTVIETKSDVDQNYIEALNTFLKKTYMLDENQEAATGSASSDITVILGNKKAE